MSMIRRLGRIGVRGSRYNQRYVSRIDAARPMATPLRCPSGHTWQANGSETIALCPVCGAAALELGDPDAPTLIPKTERADVQATIAFPPAQPGAPDTLIHASRDAEELILEIVVPGYV